MPAGYARITGPYVSPVYVRAYLNVGAEGLYEFDQKRLKPNAWLNGGAEGGIKAFGKRYSIIHLMVNAKETWGKLKGGRTRLKVPLWKRVN